MATAKPVLRNLLLNRSKIHFSLSLVLAFAAAGIYKFTVEVPRKKRYEEFLKTYDADAAYERMKAAGVFQYYKGEDDE